MNFTTVLALTKAFSFVLTLVCHTSFLLGDDWTMVKRPGCSASKSKKKEVENVFFKFYFLSWLYFKLPIAHSVFWGGKKDVALLTAC